MLCNILLLFVCMPTTIYILSAPTDRRNVESNTTFKTFFRKQYNIPKIPLLNILKLKHESYYEPYWSNGDWVFYRGESTSRPQPFFLNEGNSTQHDECNQICPQFVQDYGYVCAARYNYTNTEYEHRTFKDYCYMELENCYSVSRSWFPVKKGNCTEAMTTQSFAHMFMVTMASRYEANYTREESIII